jgi:hypothetical protein
LSIGWSSIVSDRVIERHADKVEELIEWLIPLYPPTIKLVHLDWLGFGAWARRKLEVSCYAGPDLEVAGRELDAAHI